MRSITYTAILAGAICFLPSAGIGQVQYQVIDLGSLGGTVTAATGINDSEEVAGYSENAEGHERAFSWKHGVMTDLGTLSGSSFSYSHATGINRSGVVAGFSADTLPGRPVRWTHGSVSVLEGLEAPAGNFATALNDSGDIVGLYEASPQSRRGFLWRNGTVTDLGVLFAPDPQSEATAVNNSGQVVGSSDVGFGPHPFLWQNGVMTDLTPSDGRVGAAYGINDSGVAVGWHSDSGGNHPFLWKQGVMQHLDTDPDHADLVCRAINNAGQIVGSAPDFSRPFEWEEGTFKDLQSLIDPDSGWSLSDAEAVNSLGEIVGSGVHNGLQRAFLLRPLTLSSVGRVFLLPEKCSLGQNYPNPFNPSTRIGFALSESRFVTLQVFDLLGREVATIVREELPAGSYERTWNAGNNAGGVYVYRMTAGGAGSARTMLLIR